MQEIYFDVVARSAETDAVDRPVTVQWKFADAEAWHIRIDNGSTAPVRGLAEKPDVTLETTWPEWIEISMHGARHPQGRAAAQAAPARLAAPAAAHAGHLGARQVD